MNYEKYLQIRKVYGKHASWAIWSDEKDTPTSNMEDVSFFDDKEIYKQLNPNIILVGLNISTTFDETPFLNFHGKGGGAYKIRYATKDTPFWGAYLTDIIKDFPEAESNKAMSYLKKNPDIVDQNIVTFLQEIKDLGSENPKIFAFGNDAYNILDSISNKKFSLHKLHHYSWRGSEYYKNNKENYRKHLLEQIYR
tara:strand:- start:482 stop:1066 length:585 start_codon:yes stop_codon:yes gene_type:complete